MAPIPETYAPPSLRHALLQEDYPNAVVHFDEVSGSDGVFDGVLPQRLRGDKLYCVAVINFPDGRPPAVGFKPIPPHGVPIPKVPTGNYADESDGWDMLCTKALGRALKRAGYPADLPALKAVVLWRQRQAEIRLIAGGGANIQLAQAPIEAALMAAGTTTPDSEREDDHGEREDVPSIPQTTGEGDLERVAVTEVTDRKRREILNQLGSRQKDLTMWCKEHGMRVTAPKNELEARQIVAEGERMLGEAAQPTLDVTEAPAAPEAALPAGDDPRLANILEVLEGLDEADTHAWEVQMREMYKADPADPATWPADRYDDMLGWLALGD